MALKIGNNEVDNLAIGSTEIDAIMLGSNLVWKKQSKTIYGWHVDPSISDPANAITYLKDAVGKRPANITKIQQTVKGYRDVEYLETTGTQMIVTDFGIPNFNYSIEVDIDGSNTLISPTGYPSLFGTRYPNFQVNAGYSGSHPNMSLAFYAGFAYSSGLSDYSITTNYFTGSSHKRATIRLKRGNSGFIPQDTTYPASTVGANATITETPDVNAPICFMGLVKSGGVISPFDFMNVNWYGAKVYDDSDVLVHNLIPVERITDNELGLVDTITGKFYSNAGTGTFFKGSYINTADYWFDYGDWEEPFFMPKPCMLRYDGTVAYYLNPNDYRLKAEPIDVFTADDRIAQGGWGGAVGDHITQITDPNDTFHWIRCRIKDFYRTGTDRRYVFSCSNPDIQIACGYATSDGVKTWDSGWQNMPYCLNGITSTISDKSQTFVVLRKSDNTAVTPAEIGTLIITEMSSIDLGSFDGNAMMEWPLIWYKFEAGEADGEGSFYCADYQVDSSYKCWCNYDANNNIIPHFYTPIYNITILSSKARSLSGLALTAAHGAVETGLSAEISAATSCNTTSTVEWYTGVWADWSLISALLILMGKSLDAASVYGKPYTSTIEDYTTGTLDDKGLFWGDTSSGALGVKVFGMENFYGILWKRIAGLITDGGAGYYYKLTYGTADGTSVTGYNQNQSTSGYIQKTGMPTSGDGYIKKMFFGQFGMLPSEIGGTNATYYSANFVYGSNGHGYCLIGGESPFNIYVGGGYNWTSDSYGGSLSCKPLLRNS